MARGDPRRLHLVRLGIQRGKAKRHHRWNVANPAGGRVDDRDHARPADFWAYSFAYYTQSGATAQQRTVLADYDACVDIGGIGNEIPCKREWGSFHPAGMNFAMCDGSVRLIRTDIDLNLFENLATIAGGEPGVNPPD